MILVTGASGFVGQHLVRLLSAKEQQVRAVYNTTLPGADLMTLPNVSWVQADLLDIFSVEEIMQGVTHIYHCAAIVSFDPSRKEQLMHWNVDTIANVVNEALLQNVQKLVYLSSIAALGRSSVVKEITEEEEWEESRYNSSYSMSKYLAEMEAWRGAGEGLNVVVLNPGIILGEGDWSKGSAALIDVAYKEFPFYTAGVNSFVDVKDVAQIAWQLMDSNIEGERFIVSAGNFAYRDIFTMMAQALNKRPPHIRASKWMSSLVWRFNWLKSKFTGKTPTLTKETARTAQRQNIYSNAKLLAALQGFGYTPMEETVKRMAAAYLKDRK